MFGNPLACAVLDGHSLATFFFQLLSVVLNLTDLLDHACAKQGVLIGEGNTDQVMLGLSAAPGNYARVTRLFTKQGDAHFDQGATAKAAIRIAGHTAEADVVQALPRNIALPA